MPVDDTHTLHLWYTAYVPPKGEKVAPELLDKVYVYDVPLRGANGEFIMDNIDAQDMMVWVTQGPIADRTQENLGASDNGIALYRRVLRREIKKVEEGIDPMFTFRDAASEPAHRPAERAQEAPQQRRHAELDHAHARRLFADRRRRDPDVRGAQSAAAAAAVSQLHARRFHALRRFANPDPATGTVFALIRWRLRRPEDWGYE